MGKLCKVKKVSTGQKAVPYLVTHDALVIEIATGKITQSVKFDSGMLCMITGGHNLGRVGIIVHRDRHPGSFDIVHVKDSLGHTFATRLSNVFVIGQTASNPLVSIPRGKGLKLTIAEERDRRLATK